MIEVKFTVATAEELQATIERVGAMLGGVQMLPITDPPSLALYSDEELLSQLAERGIGGPDPEPSTDVAPEPAPAPRKKPGRPPKLVNAAPADPAAEAAKAAAEAVAAAAAAPAEPKPEPEPDPKPEPEPEPAAVAVAKPVEPSQEAGTVTQNLPTVDQMLKLMTTVYSKCGDIQMVRAMAEKVCGKVNLADCAPDKFPELKRLLESKLVELQGAAA